MKLLNKKSTSSKNFFDYPSRERKKVIKKAAEGSNYKQAELVSKYNSLYCK